MQLEVLKIRYYGEEKLKNPPQIKGIKSIGLCFIPKKCTFPCYFLDNEVYIKCRDWFSPSFRFNDYNLDTAPLSVQCKVLFWNKRGEKFIYPDGWGAIVLRNEAWLKLTGTNELRLLSPYTRLCAIRDCFFDKLKEYCKNVDTDWYWHNFVENLLKQLEENFKEQFYGTTNN